MHRLMRMTCIVLLLAGCAQAGPATKATAQPGSTEIPSASTPEPSQAGPAQIAAPTQTPAPNPGIVTAVPASTLPPAPTESQMKITTPAFTDGQPVPARYTCTGENISPALVFEGLPAGAKSLALIVDDPDAPGGTWVHWVLYNLPPGLAGLPEKLASGATLSGTGSQGPTSFGRPGYGGPCPPPGKPHRYFFKLYALDLEPSMPVGLDKTALLKQMDGHILAQAQLMGTFQR